MAEIQILITDEANRQAMAELVGQEYTVHTEREIRYADLYIVDDASLPIYQAAIETHKQEQEPVFCPVILVRRDRSPVSVKLPLPDPEHRPFLVNEEVSAPVGKLELFRRITNLLARRHQTSELKEQNERLDEFARTLRHELRNPLNVLEGYLQIARDESKEEAFDRCQDAIGQMNRLLEDTLILLEDGAPEPKRQAVNLAELATESWEVVPASDARLVIESDRTIYADKDRLAQLFGNVFRNAVEHTGDHVTVTVGDLDGGIFIEDDGDGIAEAQRELVFEQGYSSNNAGSGIGLAVVKRVAELHGWSIRIKDGSTGGARFEISGIEVA